MVQDPGRIGLLNNVNVAGVAFSTPIKNQLAAFRMVNPRGVRIGVIYSEENAAGSCRRRRRPRPWSASPSWPGPSPRRRTCPRPCARCSRAPEAVDALWMPPDPLLLGDETRRFLLAETLKAGKPVYSFSPALVTEGALVSNGADIVSIGEQVGGAREPPGRGGQGGAGIALLIPRAELVINKKIAEKLKHRDPRRRAQGRQQGLLRASAWSWA